MNVKNMFGMLFLALVSSAAYAGVGRIPEPGVLELLAIGGVAAVAIAIRKRRK